MSREANWQGVTMRPVAARGKRAVDPHLLMNPGKIAGLDDLPGGLSGAALEAAQLPASGWAY